MGVGMGPKTLQTLGPASLRWGRDRTLETHPFLTCYLAKRGRSMTNGTSVITVIYQVLGTLASCLSRSLKVVITVTNRTADPVIHSNCGPVSYTVSEINGDFGQKLQISLP